MLALPAIEQFISVNRMGAPAVSIKNLSVEFPVLNSDRKSLRSTLLHFVSGRRLKPAVGMTVRSAALKAIDLKVWSGERIALIGRNGAGKSTLLKVLAGVYYPTSGNISVEGRVSALLGGSMGLDNDMSGWEAMAIGCLLLGLTSAEIRERREAIAEFTELGGYLDMPVRTYSSGMRLRLAFAIATSISPDVLLIDEVIGAGDMHFIEKSRDRAISLMQRTQVTFLASHAPGILHAICNKAILLVEGEIVYVGTVGDTLREYNALPREYSYGRLPNQAQVRAFSDSNTAGHEPENVCTPELWRFWQSARPGKQTNRVAYVGFDFEERREIRSVAIRQWVGAGDSNAVSQVLLQASDDNFLSDVVDVATLTLNLNGEREVFAVTTLISKRYWRILALDDTLGARWSVSEFELSAEVAPMLSGTARGQCICSGSHSGTDPTTVFDLNPNTYWVSLQKGNEVAGNAYIGYDFGLSNEITIRRIRFCQRKVNADRNVVSEVLVQSSDDNFVSDIQDVARSTISPNSQVQQIDCPPSTPKRFWRLVAATGTIGGGHWIISELAFSAEEDPPRALLNHTYAGTPIAANNAFGHPPAHAFDQSFDHYWQSDPAKINEKVWIGLDLGEGVRGSVSAIILQQRHMADMANYVDRLLIEVSDDEFISDIRLVAEITVARNSFLNCYSVLANNRGRFVRAVVLEMPTEKNSCWAVQFIGFVRPSGEAAMYLSG